MPVVDRPLEMAAMRVARVFDLAMIEERLTNDAVADIVGVHEKEIRQWRAAKKRIPLAAVLAMPPALCERVIRAVIEEVRRG